jgi:Type I restriction modification DNA specificity domain
VTEIVPLAKVIVDARPGFACGEIDVNGVVQIRMNNVSSEGALVFDSLRRVPCDAGALGRFKVEPGDVLFNATNSPELVGKSALFRGYPEPVVYSNHFVRLRPLVSRLDSGYLSRWLHMLWRRGDFSRMCKQWVNQASVASDRLLALEIPLPPLPEQRRIAAILDRVDELRAKRRMVEERLGGMADALFSELERSPGLARLTKVSLRDAFWFQEGPGVRSSQFRPEGVKLLNVGNIERNGTLNLSKTRRFISEEEFNSKYRHFAVDEGDLVIASSGISFDEDGFLRTRGAFVQAHHLPLCMNTSTIRFKAIKDKSNLRFLSGWLNSLSFRSQVTRLVTGSAQQNFGPSHLQAISIALPPLRLQESLADKLEAIDRLRESYNASLATMSELFSTLQHRAFAGALLQ